MTPRHQKKLRQPRSAEPLHVTHRHAAGIDVHSAVHWVAVPPEDAPVQRPIFPAFLTCHVNCRISGSSPVRGGVHDAANHGYNAGYWDKPPGRNP